MASVFAAHRLHHFMRSSSQPLTHRTWTIYSSEIRQGFRSNTKDITHVPSHELRTHLRRPSLAASTNGNASC
jgi:hypothetical protein